MTHLVLACFNAGRPVDSLKWAKESIASGARGRHLRTAHRMAGVACGNLGRLDESEDHIRRAYDVAAAEADTGEMGQILGALADVQRKRGKLVEANEACQKAAAVDPGAVRMALAVQSQILSEWGRFDDAIATLSRYAAAPEARHPGTRAPHPCRVRARPVSDGSRMRPS